MREVLHRSCPHFAIGIDERLCTRSYIDRAHTWLLEETRGYARGYEGGYRLTECHWLHGMVKYMHIKGSFVVVLLSSQSFCLKSWMCTLTVQKTFFMDEALLPFVVN